MRMLLHRYSVYILKNIGLHTDKNNDFPLCPNQLIWSGPQPCSALYLFVCVCVDSYLTAVQSIFKSSVTFAVL